MTTDSTYRVDLMTADPDATAKGAESVKLGEARRVPVPVVAGATTPSPRPAATPPDRRCEVALSDTPVLIA